MLIFPERPYDMEIDFALSLDYIDKLCLDIYFSTTWLKQNKNMGWKMPIPLSKVIYRLSICFQFMLCQANNHQEKKLKRSILLECIQNVLLCLSRVTVSILTRKKIVSFVCFGTLLDCLCGSDIFLI